MQLNNRRGFTLIEVIVVAGIIAILAGVLVPMIFNQIDESRRTRALADCKSIQTAIMTFRKDTGTWPNKTASSVANVTLLSGVGTPIPDADLAARLFDVSVSQRFVDHLKVDDNGAYGTVWKGPYLTSTVEADPWGNTYIMNAKNLNDEPATPVWIISAGPDGILDTPANADVLVNNDVGIRIK